MRQEPRHLLVLALCLVAISGCRSTEALTTLDQLEYQWAAGPPLEGSWLPAKGMQRGAGDGRPIWYRAQVPAVDATDPAVFITGALFSDIARVGTREVDLTGTLMIVPLGPSPTVVMVRESARGGLSPPTLIVGSERTLWAGVLSREFPPFVVGAMMTLAGLLLLSTALRRGAVRSYRGLGLFLLSLGIITVINSPLRHLFGVRGEALYYLHEIATTLYPVGFVEFVLATFGDGPRGFLRRGLKLFAAYAAVAWALHLAGLLEMNTGRAPVALFITAFLIQAIVLAVRRARNNDPSAKSFLLGIGALLLISFPDILDAATIIDLPFQTVPWAVLAFGLAMIAVIERQHAQAREASEVAARDLAVKVDVLEARNKEIDALNQELRHQVVERSRQMVDVLQQGRAEVTASRRLETGDTIDGRYTVTRVLGRGAMGVVHQVERTTDHRSFALKMMTGSVNALAGARFAREAEIAARADDEHLVKVVDVGGSGAGQLYIVMELVEGRSLEDARGRFGEVPWAVEVLHQIACGLRALHAMGVVHRDLKPANVLLTTGADGLELAKISDFGISRLDSDTPLDEPASEAVTAPITPPAADELHSTQVSTAPGGSLRESAPRLTATGAFMGTPAYMAPELAKGARIAGPAADLFALGLIAYELLSGTEAFREPPLYFALAGRELSAVTPLPAKVPEAIAELVLRCLAEAAEARPTAQEFIDVVVRTTPARAAPPA